MTTNHHTALPFRAPLTSAQLNGPLSELDAAISQVIASGSGVSTSLTVQANAGATSLTVASAAGLAIGDSVFIGAAVGPIETKVLSNVVGNVLTVTALANTHAVGTPVSKSPVELVLARGASSTIDGRLDGIDADVAAAEVDIAAIEAELGADPSGTFATVLARLNVAAIRAERATSSQNVATNTDVTVIFNSLIAEDDENAEFSYNASTGELTINRAGWYGLSAGYVMQANATGTRRLDLILDGSNVGSQRAFAASNGVHCAMAGTDIKVDAGDIFKAVAWQNSTATLTVDPSRASFLAAHRIR